MTTPEQPDGRGGPDPEEIAMLRRLLDAPAEGHQESAIMEALEYADRARPAVPAWSSLPRVAGRQLGPARAGVGPCRACGGRFKEVPLGQASPAGRRGLDCPAARPRPKVGWKYAAAWT